MLRLKQKLSLGFGGLLVIIVLIGVQSILYFTKLGESIDVILRENYRSVIACQNIKEALERVNSGILFILLGDLQQGDELISKNEPAFAEALRVELNNVTLPQEDEKAAFLQELFVQFKPMMQKIQSAEVPFDAKRDIYFTHLLPLFQQIKDTAEEILQMNQKNMSDANDRARRRAAAARKQMYLLLGAGTIIAGGFIFFSGRWILHPINRLTKFADEIRRGNLDLVVPINSWDEIGHLSESFNAMTASLREFRRSGQAKLARIQHATQRAFDSLPDAVAVIDLEGKVEVATETARNIFGLRPNTQIHSLPFGWITDLYNDALSDGYKTQQKNTQKVIQQFVNGEERYFRPEAVPILDNERQPTGLVLVLHDVTQLRQQDELKKGLISTVSHQLKTPLTSIRMAIHLLLEEKVGVLTEKQGELLVAAREDSDRLHGILNNLLDISRIESGRITMKFRVTSPQAMVLEALDPFQSAAQDQGVTLSVELPGDLPEVWADSNQINHVFDNLVSNALKYTPPGGTVTLSAKTDEKEIRFCISDTGKGIPSKYFPHIFEQFFRVPDQETGTGAGLGLAIVKEIVEAHGGTVSVESQEGKGSTFCFTLRRADQVPNEERS